MTAHKSSIDLNRRNYIKAAGAGALATGVAGCTGSLTGGASGTFKVGQITPLSGPFVQAGENVIAAAEVAQEHLSEEEGYDVELLEADSQTDPAKGQEEARQMIRQDDVDLVSSTGSGSVALSVSKVTADNEVLNITAASQDPMTSEECQPYTFNLTGRTDTMGNASIPWLIENEGVESFAFLSSDYGWGHEAWASYQEIFQDLDAELKGNVYAPFGATDFSNQIQQTQDMDPDVVGITAWGTDIIQCINQMREFGVDYTPLIMWTSISVMKGIDDMEDVYASGEYYWGIDTDANRQFVEDFEEMHGKKPPVESYNEYVGIMNVVKTANELGTKNADELAAELEGASVEAPKGGTNRFRECDHQLVEDWVMLEGKPSSDQESEDDVAEILARRSGEDITGPCLSSCDLPAWD
jgi:branched-chain amino acid transport system substrate-binding protein